MKDSLATFSASLDDRMGAILVKEARQAVRSRFVIAVQYIFLALLVGSLAVVLLGGRGGDLDRDAGRGIFVALNTMLHAVCVLCVPLYTGVRLAAERGDANVDLMFSTTLRPWEIVLGKAVSGLLVGLLAVSACAPFMVLCYFLRGVDVPTIAFCIGVDLVFLVLATVLSVFIGALPVGWVVKGIVALVYGAVASASVRGLGYEMAREFTRRGVAHEIFRSSDGWVGVGVVAFVLAAATGLFFMLASALIAPATANRALPVRAYLTGLWAVSVAVVGGLAFQSTVFRAMSGVAFVWAVVWAIVWALGFIVAVSERDAPGARLRREIPETPGKRKLAFLFYSGAAGGIAWCAGMAALTLGVAWTAIFCRGEFSSRGTSGETGKVLWNYLPSLALALAMVLAYALLATGIRRHLLSRFTRGAHTGAIAVGLMVAGMLAPVLLSFLFGAAGPRDNVLIHVFNPIAVFFHAVDHDSDSDALAQVGLLVTVAMLSVGAGLSGAWFLRQARAFAAPEKGREAQA